MNAKQRAEAVRETIAAQDESAAWAAQRAEAAAVPAYDWARPQSAAEAEAENMLSESMADFDRFDGRRAEAFDDAEEWADRMEWQAAGCPPYTPEPEPTAPAVDCPF